MEEENNVIEEQAVEQDLDIEAGMDDLLCMDVVDRVLDNAMVPNIDTEAKINEILGI